MKIIFLKLIFTLQIILYAPLILLVIIIYPVLKIRIGCVKSKSFGSLVLEPEIFLCEKRAGIYKKNEIFLWYHEKIISNKYLLDKRKKQLIFLPGFLLHPIIIFFSKFKFTHKHIYVDVVYNSQKKKFIINFEKLYTDQKLLKKHEPSIVFSKDEIELGDKYLKKNNIYKDDKIILFGARSSFYKNENFVSLRNSDIGQQAKSMKYVAANGYKAIRVGKEKIKKLNTDSNRIFDYTFADYNNDFLDIYIPSRAKFMVTGPTGLNELATIMRVPRLLINFTPFKDLHYVNESFTPIILFKKLFSKSLKKNLGYKEIFEKKLFDVDTVDKIPNEYQLVDNTEDEILEATIEMIKLIDNKCLNLKFEVMKQNKFWKIYQDFYGSKKDMIISPSFFQKNIELFN